MWAGETPRAKIERLHAEITGKGAGALLVTALDEVGWLLNLRGADVDFNPVFLSYVIISADVEGTAIATLYIDDIKLGPAGSPVRAHLEAEGVRVRPYEAAVGDVAGLAAAGVSLAADPKKVSYAFGRAIEDGWVSPAPETKRARVDGDENAAGAGKKQVNKKAP
jgi:Xaa-Pro aminopeptidase